MKNNKLLVLFVGFPISLVAIYFSVVAIWIAIEGTKSNPYLSLFGLLGIVSLWAVFTGIRNLLRFSEAHLQLRWHDWVGGLAGAIINAIILGVSVYFLPEEITRMQSVSACAIIVTLIVTTSSALTCFAIVLGRYIKLCKT